jgi:hypothetical protein
MALLKFIVLSTYTFILSFPRPCVNEKAEYETISPPDDTGGEKEDGR